MASAATDTKVMAIATETGAGVFGLGGYGGVTPRLAALTWGAEDLAAVLGAANRRPDGVYDDTFRLVRALCVIAAQAAGVEAIDTIYADFRDEAGLRAESQTARRAGFTGKLAIHPAQLAAYQRNLLAKRRGAGLGTRRGGRLRGQPRSRHDRLGWQNDRPTASRPGSADFDPSERGEIRG